MQLAVNEYNNRFPTICFRKKRLTVVICVHFDMESARDASLVKEKVEQAIGGLASDGHAKVTYSVVDL